MTKKISNKKKSQKGLATVKKGEETRQWKAVVVGSAVMDTIFRIPEMPQFGQSVQVDSFHLHPGGKGLVQAVAAARLGMQVELIASVGNDGFARKITSYLEKENVGTSLLTTLGADEENSRLHQSTPVTGVIKYRNGWSIALGWKNDTTIRLKLKDLREAKRKKALQDADVVFVTFEVPLETVSEAISIATSSSSRPLIVVTPAPPYEGMNVGRETLGKINYLVTQEWEAIKLLPGVENAEHEPRPKESLAARLKNDGVDCVCIVDETGSLIHDNSGRIFQIPSYNLSPRDTAGARDAFAVTLALKVMETGEFNLEAAHWAAAAWAVAASTGVHGVPEAMPNKESIAAAVERHRTELPSCD